MGLFGPKIPKEEKNYQKALKDALHKPNTKNINEMKSALASYPNGWQGYWICAVYHDQGFDKTVRDEAKAQEYFAKAENAARGTDHEVWMQEFLTWYRRDAGHLEKPLTAEEERARRLGIAMCYCSLLGDLFLTAPYEKYCGDSYVMYKILSHTNMEYDEEHAFSFMTIPTYSRDEQIKGTNKYIEYSKKSTDAYGKCKQAIRDGKEPNWNRYHDMYDYFIAVNCIHGGNLLTEELAEKSEYLSETDMGINYFIWSGAYGCQPAIHELVRLAKGNQKNFEVIQSTFECRSFSEFWEQDLDLFLKDKLEECIENNDTEAKRLYQMYY